MRGILGAIFGRMGRVNKKPNESLMCHGSVPKRDAILLNNIIFKWFSGVKVVLFFSGQNPQEWSEQYGESRMRLDSSRRGERLKKSAHLWMRRLRGQSRRMPQEKRA